MEYRLILFHVFLARYVVEGKELILNEPVHEISKMWHFDMTV